MSNSTFICSVNAIAPTSGRAALVDGQQVAIFRVTTSAGEHFFALDNFCPFSQANVLSRGIVGSLKGKWVVASPIYKQHFDLQTGICLEYPPVSVSTWPVTCEGDQLFIVNRKYAAA